MIQIIPFQYDSQPGYLPLLVRGLADLTTLRFNTAQLDAELNTGLEIKQLEKKIETVAHDFKWEGQELWFTGKIHFVNEQFEVTLAVFDPAQDKVVYRDIYKTSEKKFLEEWEEHIHVVFGFLVDLEKPVQVEKVMYTRSLEAFLEFRNGLELLTQTKKGSKREEGLEHLLAAVAYDPDFIEAADILLLFLIQNNITQNYDYAIAILERLRLYAQSHPRIPLVMAEIYYQWSNYEKAEQLLKEMTAQFPDFSEGWLRLALFYHSQDDYQGALEVLKSFLARQPEHATAMDLMGTIYAGLEEYEQAAKVWLRTLAIDPGRVNVLNNLGLLSEEAEDLEAAESYYLKAIQLNDHWWGSYYNFGSFCIRQGRIEEGVTLLTKAAVLNPSHYPTFLILSETQLKLGRFIEAQESLMQLLQIAPDNNARRQALRMLEELNKRTVQVGLRLQKIAKFWEDGRRGLVLWSLVKYFRKARHLWYYWYLWSIVLAEMKLTRSSVMALKAGFRLEPGYPLLKKLGLYYCGKGLFEKALPVLRKAFQLCRSDDQITRAYLETLVKLGEVEEYQTQIRLISQIDRSFMA